MNFTQTIFGGTIALFLLTPARGQTPAPTFVPAKLAPPAANPYLKPEGEKMVEDLLSQMTLEEKIKLCQGDIEGKAPPSRGSAAIDRFGIKPMVFYNGGRGYQMGKGTVFPPAIGQASTWNPDLVAQLAKVIAQESLAGKANCLEAPMMNIIRDPIAGRDFESFTEDPYLNGKLTAAFVRGAQDAGAPGTAKGLICYNQETNRNHVDNVVDERALREIYYPAFQAGIDAGVLGIMTSPSQVNGVPASSSADVIGVFKKEFGFQGFILTDWNGVQETVPAANAGTDLSMPGKLNGEFSADKLGAAVKAGQVSEATITDKARRLLRALYFAGLIKGGPDRPAGEAPNAAHYGIAAEVADESMVLLKNEGHALPLDASAVKKVAVLGPDADKHFPGGGSSGAGMLYEVTALEGIQKRLGADHVLSVPLTVADVYELIDGASVKNAAGQPGFDGIYHGHKPNSPAKAEMKVQVPAIDFNWEMASPDRQQLDTDKFSGSWSGTLTPPVDGRYTFRLSSSGKGSVKIDGHEIIDKLPYVRAREGLAELKAGQPVQIEVTFDKAGKQGADSLVRFEWVRPDFASRMAAQMTPSLDAARQADVAVVCLGLDHSYDTEGSDRQEMSLPPYQAEFLKAVIKANPHTVVVLYAGAPIDVRDWIKETPALLLAWYPGNENGSALAKILFGDVNPSGHLPVTFPEKYEDSPAAPAFQKEDKRDKVMHNEGIFVGYRWFDDKKIAPAFPFGHGLSYTTFAYKSGEAAPLTYHPGGAPLTVSVDVTNTGTRAGAEVVQLYVHPGAPSVPRPPEELKGFQRVDLKPGESRTVKFTLQDDAFAFWHPEQKKWVIEPGAFELGIGSSSRDLRVKLPLQVGGP